MQSEEGTWGAMSMTIATWEFKVMGVRGGLFTLPTETQ